MSDMTQGNQSAVGISGGSSMYASGGGEPANLADILERVLDKGLVIAGDIRVNLLDIELLTVKLRLVVASLETAREVGMDWWEHDPWFTGQAVGAGREGSDRELEKENRQLRRRVAALEGRGHRRELESDESEREPDADAERER